MKWQLWAEIGGAIIVLLFLIWPTTVDIHVLNTLNESQNTSLTVKLWGVIPVYSGDAAGARVTLPKGRHTIHAERWGFFDLDETMMLRVNPFTAQKEWQFTIREKRFSPNWPMHDPTGTLQLDPYIHVTGSEVRGRELDEILRQTDTLPWGWYGIRAFDTEFEGWFGVTGETLQVSDINITEAWLEPNGKYYAITDHDLDYIKHYLADYVNLSAEDEIIGDYAGLPRQFFLATQNETLSFGDMVFVLCEAISYDAPQEEYFVPKNHVYTTTTDSFRFDHCYRNALHGYIPATINKQALTTFIDGARDYYPWDEMLNSHQRRGEFALTFDVESGRYVFNDNKGPNAINPCDVEGFVEEEDRYLCDDANAIGWFSPVMGEPESDIPYPWSSGVSGLQWIRDLTARIGIPVTLYMVTQELGIYDTYDPSLLADIEEMSAAGLLEIGFHSKYHSHLGTADHVHTKEEWAAEKALLEARFNTEVVGHRAPYLSILENNQELHEETLKEVGFDYFTHGYGLEQLLLKHKGYTAVYLADNDLGTFEWNQNAFGYILTIDHPWNLHYQEEEHDGEWYLVYNESRAVAAKALVYEAISAGFIPVRASVISVPAYVAE